MRPTVLRANREEWSELLSSSQQTTTFHHPDWMETINDTYGMSTMVCGVEDSDGRLLAGIPVSLAHNIFGKRKLVALSYSDYMYPILTYGPDHAEIWRVLCAGMERHANEMDCSSIELRWGLPEQIGGWHKVGGRVLHVLRLGEDADETYRAFGKKFRQYPRKASRKGLQLSERPAAERLRGFYRLHTLTRVKLGVPVQPWKFFLNLKRNVIEKGNGEILLIENEQGIAVSAAIVLCVGEHAMIKYSASDPEALRSRCHYLLFWKCIEWAHEKKMKEIDFGRSDISDKGLRKFKSGWNAEELPLTYSYYGDATDTNEGGFAEKVSRITIRLLGGFGCRLLGKLFYRYAG